MKTRSATALENAATVQDAWEVCLSTRTLASFLDAQNLCVLSTAARFFVPCREQSTYLKTRCPTPAHFSYLLEYGSELMTLDLTYSEHGFDKRDNYIAAITPLVQSLPKLQHLYLLPLKYSTLHQILNEGLGPEGKARLKSLEIDLSWERDTQETRHYAATLLQGMNHLESLKISGYDDRRSVLFFALERASFPRLTHFELSGNPLYNELPRIQQLLFHGSLRHVTSLGLTWNCFSINTYSLEFFLPFFARFDVLDLSHSAYIVEGAKARFQAAADAEDCKLILTTLGGR